jgi:23S rRNA (adenine2503-C2)-methyltransferase
MLLLDLKNLTLPQLTDFVRQLGMADYRADQIFSWLYRPGITSFDQMTDIKKELRAQLAQKAIISRLVPEVIERSQDGTVKYGFRLHGGGVIESVLIPDGERRTLCVSSQVGCGMGCTFCLTGTMGFGRNLQPSEIVGQVVAALEQIRTEDGGELNNLVFMGMGEPLANFNNLVDALDILTDPRGLAISGRRITVSTCGIVPRIKSLGNQTAVNLAVSLHSVDDAIRSRLMPINETYNVEALLAACQEFPLPPRRRIMFEYIMIKGLNDSIADARQLAKKLHGIRCKINLLPFNAIEGFPYERPSRETIEAFQQVLCDAGYTTLIRESRGADISAACGQLAVKHTETPEEKQ